jgi:hypothetical protein
MMEDIPDIKPKGNPYVPKLNPRFRAKRKRDTTSQRANALDLKKIRAWSQVGCTREEIAHLLGVDVDWFNVAIADYFDINEAILNGIADFKHSLRSKQARLALSGHPGMLIWLGKQFLGQSDKQESKQETTVNVVLQNAMKELRDMSKNDLLAIKQILENKQEPLVIDNGVIDNE